MWWTIGKSVGRVYLLLWMVAVGGIAAANVAGLLSMIFVASENKATYVAPWVHTGWVIGAGLAFVGAITGNLRMISGAPKEKNSVEPSNTTTSHATKAAVAPTANPDTTSSLPSAVLGIGFFGGLLGFLFGVSLLVFWFSLGYSPFAVAEWVESIKVSSSTMSPGGIPTPTKTSSHPVAIYLVAVPAVTGSLIGAIAGAIGGALGKVHDG